MNHNLIFQLLKRSIPGIDSEAGLFPNLEFNPHSSVEGCLYLITQEELKLLDYHLGYPEVI